MNILKEMRRRTVRAEVNPMDVSTVFSIYNKRIVEYKPTIQPGRFEIPPGTEKEPARLVVGPSSWWREIDPEQPLLEIPTGSITIAESIVRDYCSALLGFKAGFSSPGIFYVPGDISVVKLRAEYKGALDKAIRMQRGWFEDLVKIADIGWARTSGNPLTINDDMRMAALELGKLNKDWMTENQQLEMIRCIACGQLRNPSFPICQHCKAIADPEKAQALGLKFAV